MGGVAIFGCNDLFGPTNPTPSPVSGSDTFVSPAILTKSMASGGDSGPLDRTDTRS